MSRISSREEALFVDALEQPPAQRGAFLAQACGDDSRLQAKMTVETTPPDADILVKPHRNPRAEWQHVGQSPLKEVRVARCAHRWLVKKDGHAQVENMDIADWLDRYLGPVK